MAPSQDELRASPSPCPVLPSGFWLSWKEQLEPATPTREEKYGSALCEPHLNYINAELKAKASCKLPPQSDNSCLPQNTLWIKHPPQCFQGWRLGFCWLAFPKASACGERPEVGWGSSPRKGAASPSPGYEDSFNCPSHHTSLQSLVPWHWSYIWRWSLLL